MTIKHIVISGGGPSGLISYGIAAQLEKKEFWKLENIKSIYGCSIGAYVGLIISLGYEWEWIDDYFIKRPWGKLVGESRVNIIDIYEKKSLINERFFTEAVIPLLKGKDLNPNITLLELYNYTKIELHMFTTDINSARLEKYDISYKTFPDLPVVDALQMSMAIPIIFQPILINEHCFIDGGLLNNFPLNDCIQDQECDLDEILAFKNIWSHRKYTVNNQDSSIFDLFLCLLKKMEVSLDTQEDQIEVKYTIKCFIEDLSGFDKWLETLSNETLRRDIIENGYKQADDFLASLSL
jgi:predicted acylesterase/phospholipase RssA